MPQVVTLTLGGNTGASLMNYPINNTDFKLVKGVTNEILFFVKDTDRHPITSNALTTLGISNIAITITDPSNNTLLLGSQSNPPLSNDPSLLVPAPGIDPSKGVWLLSLPSTVIATWNPGYLRYSIICDRVGGDQVMLYTDRNYGAYSNLEVVTGPFPMPAEAITITPDMLTARGLSFYSGAFPGAASLGNISGLHSAVVNMVGFIGSITVQASLENQPSTNDSGWFTADIVSYSSGVFDPSGSIFFNTPTTGPIYFSIYGNYLWVRFIVYPEALSSGSYTSIVYRGN